MKPILFNANMVRAILAGKKTQTRRILKLPKWITEVDKEFGKFYFSVSDYGDSGIIGNEDLKDWLPNYKVGDILYVRETWRIGAWKDVGGLIAVDYKADNFPRCEWIQTKDSEIFTKYWIQSTEDALNVGLSADEKGEYHWKPGEAPTRWRPSIHMPKEAARIFLKVTDVRVQQLSKINLADCMSEGIDLNEELYEKDMYIA